MTSGLTVNVDSYTVSSATIDSAYLGITLTQKTLSDTDATPATRITANGTLTDTAGNLVVTDATPVTPDDGAGPVIIAARYEENTEGVSDDAITITFSEAIDSDTIDTANAATDFIVSGGGSLGTNSPVSLPSATSAVITLSGTSAGALTAGTSAISIATGQIADTVGNTSPTEGAQNRITVTASVVINEIMWSGTGASATQYIELRNLGDASVDIGSWTIDNAGGTGTHLTIPASETIDANGYYLITRTAADATGNLLADGISIDRVDSTLSLSVGIQSLIHRSAAGIEMDRSSLALDPMPGDADIPASMERREFPSDGTSVSDWYTAESEDTGLFENATARGTPGSANIADDEAPDITVNIADAAIVSHGSMMLRYSYTDTGGIAALPSPSFTLEQNNGSGNYSDITATGATVVTVSDTTSAYRMNALSA